MGLFKSNPSVNDTHKVGNLTYKYTSDGAWQVVNSGLTGSLSTSVRTEFTATANQTVFTVDYTPNYIDVYMNGVHLNSSDYNATDGTRVILTSGVPVGTEIYVIAYSAFTLADHYTKGQVDTNTYTKGQVDSAISISGVSDQANTSTGYIDIPAGTTAQRPSNPQTGWLRFNTTFAKLEQYDGTAWAVIDTPPLISGANYPSGLTGLDPAGGETITINGSNFQGCTVKFKATNGTLTSAPSVTTNSATLLTVTTPALAVGDYDIVVTNVTGTAGTLTPGLSVSGLPAWQSPAAGSMGSFVGESSVSITVSATEGSDTIAYSVTTGSLPGGLSLSNAVISGTPTMPAADTTTSFTMTATDDEGQTSTRAFAITVTFVYKILNSLRFNDGDSAYLSRTPSSGGDRKKWTWSAWVKLGSIDTSRALFYGGDGSSAPYETGISINSAYQISTAINGTASLKTSALYRDPSAWYHIVWVLDTAQSTATNRAKLYVNGSEITALATSTYPAQNDTPDLNNSKIHKIGQYSHATSGNFDGYLADVHFVDGQALAPTSFGEYNAVYNQWVSKKFTGAYGTNGFKLDFANSNTKYNLNANGTVKHSTSYSKIGSSSIEFDGSNSSVDSDLNAVGGAFDFGSAGDFTLEGWARLTSTSGTRCLFDIRGNHGDYIEVYHQPSGIGLSGPNCNIPVSNPLSINTWYHIAVVRSGGTIKIYKDGSSVATDTSTGQIGGNNYSFTIGRYRTSTGGATGEYWPGFIDEIRFSNNARYTGNFTPSTTAFTEDSNTLLLIHSDTTNGSTTFTDSSGVTGGLGKDASSNSNNWFTNNLRSSDQVLDTPQNNFCTLNPLDDRTGGSLVYSEGNTSVTNSGGQWDNCKSTFAVSSGKWYWEVNFVSGTMTEIFNGIADTSINNQATAAWPNGTVLWYNHSTAYLRVNGSNTGGYSQLPAGSILGLALDMDNKTLAFYGNGSLVVTHNIDSYITEATPYTLTDAATVQVHNFGQDHTFAGNKSKATTYSDGGGIGSFCYAVPTGFKALCTKNLPAPAVVPGEHFNALTWTGDGGTNRAITGVGFQPDFVWFKQRDGANDHMSFDSVRGAGYRFKNNSNVSEAYHTTTLKSFDSDGFTVGDSPPINNNNSTYVSWNWKAGTSVSGTTAGAGTGKAYSGSTNPAAGFSIITYKGNDTAGHGIPHGLSKAPEFLVVKNRDATGHWEVYSNQLISHEYLIELNQTGAEALVGNKRWYSDPDATNVYIQKTTSVSEVNGNDVDYIMYAFHGVDGYSKIGLYFGNGSADGPFIWTGFQPKYILWKQSRESGENWRVIDDARSPYNQANKHLAPSSASVESTETGLDLLSNGFKLRDADWHQNQNGKTYIYMAFAEYPFKYGNAR